MASKMLVCGLLLVALFATSSVVRAGDPDILTDFITPTFPFFNINFTVDGNFFTNSGFRGLIDGPVPPKFNVTKAAMLEFPALNGQSVSMALLRFPGGSVNPPHTHPRASELLFVIQGSLEVGFVDTTDKLYNQTLQLGDMFIFPKGLVHYQYNADAENPAIAISAFGSASPGTVSAPLAVFTTGIDVKILAKAFKTDVPTIQKIEAGLGAKSTY